LTFPFLYVLSCSEQTIEKEKTMGRPKGSKNKHYRTNLFCVIDEKTIQLFILNRSGTTRARTLIDAEDFDLAQKYVWSLVNGYAAAKTREGRLNSHKVSLHRIVTGANTGDEIDHINRDKLDNRKSNLRICTHSQNNHNNAMLHVKNTSGHKGVSEIKNRKCNKKFHAYIDLPTGRKNKAFFTFAEAVTQRKQWEADFNPSGLNNVP
jgi:hypothetical protein